MFLVYKIINNSNKEVSFPIKTGFLFVIIDLTSSSGSISAKFIISLTLTPMLASRFLRINSNLNTIGIFQLSEKLYKATFDFYQRSLLWSLDHKKTIFHIFLLTILCSMVLFKVIPKGFIPDQDVGNFIVFTEADADIGGCATIRADVLTYPLGRVM